MKRSILTFFVIGATLIFFGCTENNSTAPELSQSDQFVNSLAKKPAQNLIGTAVANFTLTPPTFWNGTIDFGNGPYGITFISHGQPRDYSQASPFKEDFIIYELGNPTNVYAEGWEAGVGSHANRAPETMKFVSNGKIEKAYGPLEMWEGRNVHISGAVEDWQNISGVGWIPVVALSTFRIN
jgi:hypothetical protein